MSLKKILDLKQQRSEKRDAVTALLDKATEEGRDFTDEERQSLESLKAEIKRSEDMETNYMEMMDSSEKEELRLATAAPALYDPSTRHSQEGEAPLGAFCMAVRNDALNPGGEIPNYLREQRSILGQGEQIPSDGGFLLQPEKAAGIQENMWTQGTILSRCQRRTLAGNSLLIDKIKESSRADGSRYGGVRAYWEGEGDPTTASKMSLEQDSVKLNKLIAVVYATDELLEDVKQLESKIMETVPKELTFRAEDGVIRGTGAGQMLGILESDALQSVAKESGQAADTVVTENILKMWKSRFGPDLVWLYNQELEDQLELLTVAVGTGGEMARLFVPPRNPDAESTIKGRSAFAVEQASGPGDVGDIMLVSLKDYLIGEKVGGIKSASSIHVQFLTAQNCFRFIWRITGQPGRGSKITPYKRTSSSFYLSPFNAIAAR